MSRSILVVDLDGTLCNVEHRRQWADLREWDRFHALLGLDEPNEGVLRLIQSAKLGGMLVIYLTARPEPYRDATFTWLNRYRCPDGPLLMRAKGDRRASPQVKRELLVPYLDTIGQSLENVAAVLEDRPDVAEMWKRQGVPVLFVLGDGAV